MATHHRHYRPGYIELRADSSQRIKKPTPIAYSFEEENQPDTDPAMPDRSPSSSPPPPRSAVAAAAAALPLAPALLPLALASASPRLCATVSESEAGLEESGWVPSTAESWASTLADSLAERSPFAFDKANLARL